tara:strand:- start:1616 stop:2776 length:1161 start_codon:yes stop_codon:yes gene_type:complete
MNKSIVLITNILTPYRTHFFDLFHQECKKHNISFSVLVSSETEDNRNWTYKQFARDYTTLLDGNRFKLVNYEFTFNLGLRSFLKDKKPDIIIGAGGYNLPIIWQAIFLKKKFRYKLLFWSESHLKEIKHTNKLFLYLRGIIRNVIYKKFDGFCYAGQLSLDFVKKYSKSNTRLLFLPNLIDNNKFKKVTNISLRQKSIIKGKYNIPKDKFLFICPARLTKVKGIDRFLEIFNQSSNKDDAYILIPGDGEDKALIESIILKYNLNVKLLGYKNEIEMIELYCISDAFLMPSLSDPNPLTSIEAVWCGLPLIVSEHVGNYPEVIVNDQNGYVFNYREDKLAKSYIDKLIISNPSWIKNAKKTSLAIAEEKYNSLLTTERLVLELKNLK